MLDAPLTRNVPTHRSECRACEGSGVVAGACLVPASHCSDAEHNTLTCGACRGAGEVLDLDLLTEVTNDAYLALVVQMHGVVARAVAIPYVISTWAPKAKVAA